MNWYQVTKSALDRRRDRLASASRLYLERHCEPPDYEGFAAEGRRIDADYRQTILAAWRRHRPDGPLDGERVPNEVARLLAEEGR